MKIRTIISTLVAVAVVGVAGAYAATVAFGNMGGESHAQLGTADQALVARGAYIATLGDCAACHTAAHGQPFAGGLPISTPIGTVYTTNITPDQATGIGQYTLSDFEHAVRRGVRPDGSSLYPAMPYPSYAHVSDDDIRALYVYFMHGVKPVSAHDHAPDIPWPMSMRWPLTYWRWMFAPAVNPAAQPTAGTVAASEAASEAANGGSNDAAILDRGRYLVEGLAHCGTCHTARGVGLQEKALSDADGVDYLAGGMVDHHVANNLRGDDMTGLGRWSKADIVEFLRTGRNSETAAFGGMQDVVVHSTQYMNDADLNAIASYLKSLSAGSNSASHFVYQNAAATSLASGNVSMPGALDYLNSCAACHRSSGKGYKGTFPALAGNSVVNAADPTSLINIVLNGSTETGTSAVPTQFAMPPFGDRLTDDEVAHIVTFIRSSWGNDAPAVDATQVAKIRSQTHAAAAAVRSQ
jgi:mono/diheme cytochrome c family protein